MPLTESNEGKLPPASWPSRGSVSFKKLCVTYAPDLPDVLHNVSFDIEPGMRVGVVGATGSGKSTLALSLFRAMDSRDGSIEIDGEDIRSIKLKELRRRLNMVVQDGSLSSGTLRDALDITRTKGTLGFPRLGKTWFHAHMLGQTIGRCTRHYEEFTSFRKIWVQWNCRKTLLQIWIRSSLLVSEQKSCPSKRR